MLKKITLSLLFLICLTAISFGHPSKKIASKHKTVLKAPKTWIKEIIPFPLDFAPSIPYLGFEDLRFAPNWSDSSHQNFWTYMFVWYVHKDAPITGDKLSEYFNAYYDGLMRIELKNKTEFSDNPLKKTVSNFTKMANGFTGKMQVYDNFFKKKSMLLYIRVRETFCDKMHKQIIRCDISKQRFEHEVWDQFDEVEIKGKCK